jgi:putative ABC transport system permease protein
VLGVEAGVLLGLALGWVLGTWSMNQPGDFYASQAAALGTSPGITVPWLWVAGIALALPLLAVGGAWLTAPRHLPLVRRLAQ